MENIADLTLKFIDASITLTETDELLGALKDDPGNRRLFDEYMDVWLASAKASEVRDYDEKAAWQNLKNKIGINGNRWRNPGKPKEYRWAWQAAAALLILLMLSFSGFVIYRNIINNPSGRFFTEYYVPFGSRSEVTLPDGSTVWLNAGSRLTFNQLFSQKNREVLLEGEAFFDVKKQKIPFFVKVNGATVQVLGTAFNVKAYPDEKIIETTVTRGSVQVFESTENTDESTHIILHANQKVSIIKNLPDPSGKNRATAQQKEVHPAGKNVHQTQINSYQVDRNIIPEIYTSWKDQRWIIEREELQSLAVKLERRYNVDFIFQDESLKRYVFSGVLKDETLEQVLEAIKLTAPIQYQIQQKQVVLSKNKFYKSSRQ